MDSLEIFEFKNSIAEYVNNSPLPLAVKQMVLNELLREKTEELKNELLNLVAERDSKND
jgi:hypothetical protein